MAPVCMFWVPRVLSPVSNLKAWEEEERVQHVSPLEPL